MSEFEFECPVCFNDFTPTDRRPVKCLQCKGNVCDPCFADLRPRICPLCRADLPALVTPNMINDRLLQEMQSPSPKIAVCSSSSCCTPSSPSPARPIPRPVRISDVDSLLDSVASAEDHARLIKYILEDHSQNGEAISLACASLRSLSEDDSIAARCVHEDVFLIVVSLVHAYKDQETILVQLLGVLASFSYRLSVAELLLQVGLLSTLTVIMEQYETRESVLLETFQILLNVSGFARLANSVVTSELLAVALQNMVLNQESPPVIAKICAFFRSAIFSKNGKCEVSEGFLHILLSVISLHQSSPVVIEHACAAVDALARNTDNHLMIIQCGFSETLTAILRENRTNSVIVSAVFSIFAQLAANGGEEFLFQAEDFSLFGIIAKRHRQNPDILQNTLLIINHVLRNPREGRVVAPSACGFLQDIVENLYNQGDTVRDVCIMLFEAWTSGTCVASVGSGFLIALKSSVEVHCRSMDVVKPMSNLVEVLSKNPQFCRAMVETGVIFQFPDSLGDTFLFEEDLALQFCHVVRNVCMNADLVGPVSRRSLLASLRRIMESYLQNTRMLLAVCQSLRAIFSLETNKHFAAELLFSDVLRNFAPTGDSAEVQELNDLVQVLLTKTTQWEEEVARSEPSIGNAVRSFSGQVSRLINFFNRT